MKNVTLAVPEDLLNKSREYARKHGTSLNQMIRDYLSTTVESNKKDFSIENIEKNLDELGVDTTQWKFNRDELYER